MPGAVRSAVVRLSANVSGLIAGYAEAKAATEDFARSTTASTNKTAAAVTSLSEKHKKAINTISNGFGIMGAAAAAGVGIAIKEAAQFDQKMSGVKAVTGEGAAGMLQLRDAAIKAGAATKYSAGEAADGITELAKAGISTSDILHGGLNGALALASAGEIGVGDAAQYMATALTQFHLKGTAASHVADLLAAGANKAQGEVGDMATALNYAGIPAAQLGVSIEQTAGTIALFAKNGLIGSQAGTTLRGVISSLTSPSKVAQKTMDGLGISVFDAHGKFIGLDGVAQQLHDHMGKLTQEERANALGRIFGNQQLQGANILYKDGAAGVDAWTKKVNDSGAAARVSAEKMNNLSGDIEQLKGSLQTALIGAGEGAQSPLRGLTQDITKTVNKFNDLSPAAQSNITKTVAAFALLGGTGFVLGKTVIGINNTVGALKVLAGEGTVARAALVGVGKGLVVAAAVYGIDQVANHLLAAHNDAKTLQQDLKLMALGVPAQPKLDFGFKNMGQQIHEAAQEMDLFGRIPTKVFGVFNTGFMQTEDNVRQLDRQLAKLAQSDPKTARSAFASIRDQARQAGVSVRDLMALFPKFEAVIQEPRKAKSSLINLGDLLSGLHGLREYKSELMKLPREVLTKVVNPGMLTTVKQVEQLGKQYKNLDAHDIRVIMRARDFAGPEIQKVLKELHLLDHTGSTSKMDANNKPATDRYRVTKAQLLELGHAHPMSTLDANFHPAASAIVVAKRLLLGFDGARASATLDANNGPLNAAVAQAQARINSLHGTTVTNYVTTVRRGGTQGGLAGGGPVVGPGTKTSDSVPVMGSNGEFMMRAAAVDRYGLDFMYRVNAMKLAAGGPVTHAPVAAPVNAVRVAGVSGSSGGGGSNGGGSWSGRGGTLEITGTLDTPFGPAQVRGIAQEVVAGQVKRSTKSAYSARRVGH